MAIHGQVAVRGTVSDTSNAVPMMVTQGQPGLAMGGELGTGTIFQIPIQGPNMTLREFQSMWPSTNKRGGCKFIKGEQVISTKLFEKFNESLRREYQVMTGISRIVPKATISNLKRARERKRKQGTIISNQDNIQKSVIAKTIIIKKEEDDNIPFAKVVEKNDNKDDKKWSPSPLNTGPEPEPESQSEPDNTRNIKNIPTATVISTNIKNTPTATVISTNIKNTPTATVVSSNVINSPIQNNEKRPVTAKFVATVTKNVEKTNQQQGGSSASTATVNVQSTHHNTQQRKMDEVILREGVVKLPRCPEASKAGVDIPWIRSNDNWHVQCVRLTEALRGSYVAHDGSKIKIFHWLRDQDTKHKHYPQFVKQQMKSASGSDQEEILSLHRIAKRLEVKYYKDTQSYYADVTRLLTDVEIFSEVLDPYDRSVGRQAKALLELFNEQFALVKKIPGKKETSSARSIKRSETATVKSVASKSSGEVKKNYTKPLNSEDRDECVKLFAQLPTDAHEKIIDILNVDNNRPGNESFSLEIKDLSVEQQWKLYNFVKEEIAKSQEKIKSENQVKKVPRKRPEVPAATTKKTDGDGQDEDDQLVAGKRHKRQRVDDPVHPAAQNNNEYNGTMDPNNHHHLDMIKGETPMFPTVNTGQVPGMDFNMVIGSQSTEAPDTCSLPSTPVAGYSMLEEVEDVLARLGESRLSCLSPVDEIPDANGWGHGQNTQWANSGTEWSYPAPSAAATSWGPYAGGYFDGQDAGAHPAGTGYEMGYGFNNGGFGGHNFHTPPQNNYNWTSF